MTLELDGKRQYLPVLFSLLKSSPLQEVTIKESCRIRQVDVPSEVATAMLKIKLRRNITTLAFTACHPVGSTPISCLGPFSSLEKLEYSTRCLMLGGCVSPLTDLHIEQLASGLPKLVTLHLGCNCSYSRPTTAIRFMISLSTHCPSLENLRLPCDLTNISEDAKAGSGGPDPRLEIQSPCKLRVLAFRWVIMSPPEDPDVLKLVASVFCHLFPLLESEVRREGR